MWFTANVSLIDMPDWRQLAPVLFWVLLLVGECNLVQGDRG
jgi:hypothetical protein